MAKTKYRTCLGQSQRLKIKAFSKPERHGSRRENQGIFKNRGSPHASHLQILLRNIPSPKQQQNVRPLVKSQRFKGEAREPPVKSRHFKKQRLSARVPFANSPRLYSYAEAATKRPCLNDASLMRFGQVNVHGRENPVFSSGVSGVIPPRARAERSWRQLRAQFFLCFLGCFQLGNLKMSHILVFDDTLEV